ncbi:hypothetical protein Tcan_08141 [Toxocara canis]|uniref:ShKT domain-containing protein n=1 Tax=Toxocara canis TaxID=6265 RepID=A0A0B2VW55_TOXCA|nr:hypothetical protein Tcan_08141 [Toxocara canis]
MFNEVFTVVLVLLLASHLKVLQPVIKASISGVNAGSAEQQASTATESSEEENVCTCMNHAIDCHIYFYLCRKPSMEELMRRRCSRTCRFC